MRFRDRVALVAGGGSGIGRAVVVRLAAEGATVVCADLNLSAAEAVAAEAGPGVTAEPLDVTDEAGWEAVVGRLLAAHGRLDLLVNSAGVAAGSPLADTPLAEWRRVLGVNLDGAFLATKHSLRAMTAGGSVVHVSSASGVKAAGGAAAYSASKAGLAMLVRAAAKECRDAGRPVRVNSVSPAGVRTPLWSAQPFFQDLVGQTGSEDAAYAALEAQPGGGRFADPADVAAAVLFLLSDEARFVTGVDLLVDAGYVL